MSVVKNLRRLEGSSPEAPHCPASVYYSLGIFAAHGYDGGPIQLEMGSIIQAEAEYFLIPKWRTRKGGSPVL